MEAVGLYGRKDKVRRYGCWWLLETVRVRPPSDIRKRGFYIGTDVC